MVSGRVPGTMAVFFCYDNNSSIKKPEAFPEMIRDRSFYRFFFILTFSIALQNLLTYGVNMMDTLMLGRYSQDAMSGVSLCNQVQFLLQMLSSGAAEGAVVLGAQYWGKERLEPIPSVIGAALRFGGALAAVLFLVVSIFPDAILKLLSNDAAVIAQGRLYFSVIRWSYLIFVVTHILAASLRSIGIVAVGQMIAASTLVINVCLNYCLIYGNFGFPELGVRGAALATLTARCIELVIVILYLKYREHRLNLSFRNLVFIDTSYLGDFFRVSAPVLLNSGLWGFAQMIQTAVLGHLGGDVTAANAIAVQVFQILSVAAYGSASAACIVVGKTVGKGGDGELRTLVRTLQVIFLTIGVISGSLIFSLRRPILLLFGGKLTERAYKLAMQFMLVLSVTTVGTSYQMAVDSGILHGGGDTSFSGKMNLISMWLFVVPGACVAAYVLHLPEIVVFFLLKWDQLYKIIPVQLRLNSWKWVKNVTR